jgi:serine/threonine protein kinase
VILGYELVRRFATTPHAERWLAKRESERAIIEVLPELPPSRVADVMTAVSELRGRRVAPFVGVLDAGVVEGRVTIVVEPLLGRSLSELPSLSVGLARALVGELARQLAALHDRGQAHGALSPDDLLVTRAGELVVFGLSWRWLVALERAARGVAEPRELSLVSPEVLRGEAPTPASDVYALGRLLAELNPGASDDAELVARATAEDPRARPATAHVFAESLAAPPLDRAALLAETIVDAADLLDALDRAWVETTPSPSADAGPRGEALAAFSRDIPFPAGPADMPAWRVEGADEALSGLALRQTVAAWTNEGTADFRRHESRTSRLLLALVAACVAAFLAGAFFWAPIVLDRSRLGRVGRADGTARPRLVRLPDAPVPRAPLVPATEPARP